MLSLQVRSVMEADKLVSLPPQATVREAAGLMADRQVGAVLVVDDGRLTGIFSERDVVMRVIARALDPDKTPLAEVMTAAPKTVSPDNTFGYAMLLMQESGCRHLPVVENGRPIGVVSSRSAIDPELEEFVFEERRRRHYAANP